MIHVVIIHVLMVQQHLLQMMNVSLIKVVAPQQDQVV